MKEQTNERDVERLQTMLRTISRADGRVPPVMVSGVYGKDTVRAVRCVQELCALPPTGEADRETWAAVCRMYDTLAPSVLPAPALQLRWEPMQTLPPGARSAHLYLIQAMLRALEECYVNAPHVEITGRHDASSVRAVRWLQSCAHLPDTGTVDQRTWGILCALYRMSAGDGCPDGVSHPAPDGGNPGPEP